MSLVQFFRILWARRSIILIATFACLLGAVVIGKIIPARFKADSRVMLDIVKPDPVTGEVITSGFARAYVKTQIELITDERIAAPVAEKLAWTSSPQLAAQYQARDTSDARDFRRWLADRVIQGTSASLIEGSNILEISYTTSSPVTAAKVADTIRQTYIDQAIAFRRDDAMSNADWFQKQADRIRDQLTAAQKRKSDFERANGIVLGADNVDEESKRLAALGSAQQVGAAAAPSAPIVTQANPEAGRLAQADAAIAAASRTLGPNNPQLQDLRRQRDAIAAAAAASRPTVIQAPSARSGPSIGALYGAQVAKVLAQRGKVDEARQLATDVTVLSDQYAKTSARAADLQQQSQSTESGLTPLGTATAPQSPSFPNWPLLIFGSIGLGLALGVVTSLFIEMIGRRVRGGEDLRLGEVPLLGIMSRPAPQGGLLLRLLPRRLRPATGAM